MRKSINLSGDWDLFYFEDEPQIKSVEEIESICTNKIKASVPENFEVSLAKSGVIPEDLYKGMATRNNQIFEDYDWWYKKEIQLSRESLDGRLFLNFGAVDCIAEYFVNGVKVYESDNAFIGQRFEISDYVHEGINVIFVHISSAMKYSFSKEYNQYLANCSRDGYQAHLRKPAHSYGWDIFPRAVSGGIWRDVSLEICNGYEVSDFSYYVKSISESSANIVFMAVIDAPYNEFKKDILLNIKGKCGESEFSCSKKIYHCKTCKIDVAVDNPLLWWPYGYGDANVYDVTYELLFDNEVRDSGAITLGIRTAELVRTDTLKEDNHCFKFVVNGVDIMCKGSNWVPLSPYHSEDSKRYKNALELFTDTHCNIVRVWGGGVYEDEFFYDYCDRHGIMVWQDFCMACCTVPVDGNIAENIRQEATWVVKKLRHHPSIVLWAGDNEIDETLAWMGKHSGMNKITRQILPQVVDLNDTKRAYLASSPYMDDESSKTYYEEYTPEGDIYPERHLWGARDYYKADFYTQSRAHFVSETGYHGCPSLDSIKETVDKDKIWPVYNEQWSLHSSDQKGSLDRVKLMEDQIIQLFAFKPDNIDDFICASQISQAEAKKYFIERIRIKKPYTSGVIWWNMLDGWPQMSDAVVDYFFRKKLAYSYIKRSQQPVCLMIDEMHDWHYTLVVSNDTMQSVNGTYKVYDVMTKEILSSGEFKADKNSNEKLSAINLMYSDKKFLVIEWMINNQTFYNHYLCGYPAFDFKMYKQWLEEFEKLV